ncbi:MAG: hypothetical protein DWI02_01620 [Planctomycetota bacterium]|nr:MAG: hypothetical protein DWI02_01620 [Planctomycetota bacterium]
MLSSSVVLVERQVLIGANQRNRSQRSEGVRDSFPGNTMSELFERFGGSSRGRGKNEPAPEL